MGSKISKRKSYLARVEPVPPEPHAELKIAVEEAWRDHMLAKLALDHADDERFL
jgi:hypothetical protein